MDQVLKLCKCDSSPEMKQFLARMEPCFSSMPSELIPYMLYWAATPTFDCRGCPYLAIKRASTIEIETSRIGISFAQFQINTIKNRIKEDNKEEIVIEKKQKYEVPVVCNMEYGGYSFTRPLTSLLIKAGAYECVGLKRPEIKDDKEMEQKGSRRSQRDHGYDYDLQGALPRHHLLLVSCLTVVYDDRASLGVDMIEKPCIDFYRIEEYDGKEAILPEPDRAISDLAKRLPLPDAPIDIIQELKYEED